jgi:hypothetical protein
MTVTMGHEQWRGRVTERPLIPSFHGLAVIWSSISILFYGHLPHCLACATVTSKLIRSRVARDHEDWNRQLAAGTRGQAMILSCLYWYRVKSSSEERG